MTYAQGTLTYAQRTCRWNDYIKFYEAKLIKGYITGKLGLCEHYVIGKQTQVKFDTTTHQIEDILDYINMHV